MGKETQGQAQRRMGANEVIYDGIEYEAEYRVTCSRCGTWRIIEVQDIHFTLIHAWRELRQFGWTYSRETKRRLCVMCTEKESGEAK